jgi:hypothetical protein
MAWFEHLDHYLEQDLVDFAYAMSMRQGAQAPWRYQLHRATQVPVLRRVRREAGRGLRRYLALRRGYGPRHAQRHQESDDHGGPRRTGGAPVVTAQDTAAPAISTTALVEP